jgi:hypothetical protein
VDESGVPVGGISVGRDKPGLVAGRVAVTKGGGAEVTACGEIFMQALKLRLPSRIKIQIFFISAGILLGNY